jgi:hypothetical protein
VVSTMSQLLYPWERPSTHCTGGWVGPRAGLDMCEKSRPNGIQSLDRPARNQSLYRLSYPAHVLLHSSYIFLHYYVPILTPQHTYTYCDLLHKRNFSISSRIWQDNTKTCGSYVDSTHNVQNGALVDVK